MRADARLRRQDSQSIFAGATSNRLLRFSSSGPGALIGSPMTMSVLVAGHTLVVIDFRPAS
jgi:hypothetical protein